ncbi:MAG: DUF1501 domain-containing protein [Planctomycetota bacterium]
MNRKRHQTRRRRGALSRRDLLRLALAGAAGVALSDPLGGGLLPSVFAAPAVDKPTAGKAKAVIQIWMWGGPAHLDTFDPKPEAGYDYCGPYNKPIETNVKGIRIGQMLPELAKQADKYTILRGMTHGVNGHETASYMVQTGRKPGGRDVYPCAGAVVSLFKGYKAGYDGLIPPYIVMTKPQGRFSEAGFLGSAYKPFATGGDPGKPVFEVEGVTARGMTRERQTRRRELRRDLDALTHAVPDAPAVREAAEARERAYDLILGDAGKVFDLSQEDDKVRDRYGRNTFGQSCLMARRLVEKGVRYVTINSQGWDTHKDHFPTMQRRLPEMDKGLATLFADLDERGLLDSTIVWWGGEFGRGPKIDWQAPWNGGRSHYGAAFSSVVAGGGFKGGQVVGATDERGMRVVDRPIYPWDLIASMYTLLGIDTKARLQHPRGDTMPVVPTAEEGYASGGLLKEIM